MDKCDQIALTASCAWTVVGNQERREFELLSMGEPIPPRIAQRDYEYLGVFGIVNGTPRLAWRIPIDDESFAAVAELIGNLPAMPDLDLSEGSLLVQRAMRDIFAAYMRQLCAMPDPRIAG